MTCCKNHDFTLVVIKGVYNACQMPRRCPENYCASYVNCNECYQSFAVNTMIYCCSYQSTLHRYMVLAIVQHISTCSAQFFLVKFTIFKIIAAKMQGWGVGSCITSTVCFYSRIDGSCPRKRKIHCSPRSPCSR